MATKKFLKFIDLFAGNGGFHFAVSSLGGQCVFVSEISYDYDFDLSESISIDDFVQQYLR